MESGKLNKMSESIVKDKSFKFAIKIINLYKYLKTDMNEFVLSKQVLRCGTSIGANVNEALQGQSKKDFLMKMNISLKECSETKYWLELLKATSFIGDNTMNDLYNDCTELEKILTKIVKTTSNNIKN